MERIRTDDTQTTINVVWEVTPRDPLWDKLWDKLLSSLPEEAIQTDPNGLEYDHQISGGKP